MSEIGEVSISRSNKNQAPMIRTIKTVHRGALMKESWDSLQKRNLGQFRPRNYNLDTGGISP